MVKVFHCNDEICLKNACCDGVCVDLENDKDNCGACGNTCKHKCENGVCKNFQPRTCGIGQVMCNGNCIECNCFDTFDPRKTAINMLERGINSYEVAKHKPKISMFEKGIVCAFFSSVLIGIVTFIRHKFCKECK